MEKQYLNFKKLNILNVQLFASSINLLKIYKIYTVSFLKVNNMVALIWKICYDKNDNFILKLLKI